MNTTVLVRSESMPSDAEAISDTDTTRRSWSGDLGAFVLFLGHPRSGTTLLANLLDAHPQIIVAYQHDAVGKIESGLESEELYRQILANSREHAAIDQQTNGYTYRIPGCWQGRYKNLKVIGDKKAAAVTEQLSQNPHLTDRIRDRVGIPLRVIQVVRNPFDNIATMTRKTKQLGGELSNGVQHYFKLAQGAHRVRSQLKTNELILVRHEQLVADTHNVLGSICGRLGVQPTMDYLDACSSIVFPSAKKTRNSVRWPAKLIREVEEQIASDQLLAGYAFEEKPASDVTESQFVESDFV